MQHLHQVLAHPGRVRNRFRPIQAQDGRAIGQITPIAVASRHAPARSAGTALEREDVHRAGVVRIAVQNDPSLGCRDHGDGGWVWGKVGRDEAGRRAEATDILPGVHVDALNPEVAQTGIKGRVGVARDPALAQCRVRLGHRGSE